MAGTDKTIWELPVITTQAGIDGGARLPTQKNGTILFDEGISLSLLAAWINGNNVQGVYGGDAVPDNALGNKNDLYFRSNGGVYQKTASVWVLKATLTSSNAIVTNVAGLQAISNVATSAIVTEAGRNGSFYYTTASLTADGGTIFAATGKGSGYWVRVFTGPVSMGWFGAKGDGSTNDLTAINNAYTNYAGFEFDFIDNTFLINPVDPTYPTGFFNGGIKPKDNSTTRFIGGAKLTMATTTANAYVFFNLTGTTNVTIHDGDVMGDVATHAGSSGEDGYGYFVAGATNPQLINCKASFCWGDGFYYGSGTTGGVLANAIADNNRRNGLSIVSWTKGLVLGGIFQNTGQTVLTSPGYGIDIEPDGKGTDTINVELIGVQTYNNSRGGLQVVPGSMTNVLYTRPTFNVIIKGYMSLQDGNSGALRFAYPPLTATGIRPTIPIYGKITVTDATIQQSVGRSVDFAHWDPGAPDVQLDNLTVVDCNSIGSTATNEQQCGVVVFLDVADIAVQTTTGRITINNAKIIDTRATPLMLVPIWMNCGAGQSIDNVTIKDVVSSGQISTSNGPTVLTRTTNASITYSLPPKKDITGNLTIQSGAYAGVSLASTNSSVTTLPLAATSIGLEYPFENRYAVTYQIRPNAADHIQDYNLNGTGDIVLRAIGDSVTLKCVDANTWRVMRRSGKVTPLGFTPGGLSSGIALYAAAAPTSGAWAVGDEVFNNVPAIGAVKGWICITAGSPGTWLAYGKLGSIRGNSTTTGTATTAVTVTIGQTMSNNTYMVAITPRDLLTAVNYYINAQSTTTFIVTFVTALTGSINFDWIIHI